LKSGEASLKDLAEAIPSFAGAVRARSEGRPELIDGSPFKAKGFIEIPDRDTVFDPSASFALRDPDDCLSFAAAEEIKSLRTARRR
jgi:hypothetical protein